MKKKLYILGMVMAFGITCMGCGNTTEVTDNTEAATETVAEATTEASTKEKTTDKKDKPQNTTEDTQAEEDDQPDKTNQGSQRTTEAANRQTTGSASAQQPTTAATRQPTTQTPAQQPATQTPVREQEQPTTQQPARPATTQTTEAPTTTVCQHDWEEIMETIHHDAVMGNRCAQSAVIYHWYCFDCGCYYPELSDDPCAGANGGTADYTVREAVYEQYEAVPAYDEQVGIGRYRCTRCGATK